MLGVLGPDVSQYTWLCLCLVVMVRGLEPRVVNVLGQRSATELLTGTWVGNYSHDLGQLTSGCSTEKMSLRNHYMLIDQGGLGT